MRAAPQLGLQPLPEISDFMRRVIVESWHQVFGRLRLAAARSRYGSIVRFRLRNNNSTPAFSPDGRTLASGTYHEVKLWDAETGLLRRKLSEESRGITYRVAFSPGGKTLAGASDATVKLWDVSGIR
jgi:WD40 repeat protein